MAEPGIYEVRDNMELCEISKETKKIRIILHDGSSQGAEFDIFLNRSKEALEIRKRDGLNREFTITLEAANLVSVK